MTITLEIEHALGEDIDMDGLRTILRDLDIKVKNSKTGAQLLVDGVIDRIREKVELAIQLADPPAAELADRAEDLADIIRDGISGDDRMTVLEALDELEQMAGGNP